MAGNIRQLKHTIEHSMTMTEFEDTKIEIEHLPSYISDKFCCSSQIINKSYDQIILETKVPYYFRGIKK